MTDAEARWADDVARKVQEYERAGFKSVPPIVDLAVASDLGFTADQTAAAIAGYDPNTLTRIVSRMRELGMIT